MSFTDGARFVNGDLTSEVNDFMGNFLSILNRMLPQELMFIRPIRRLSSNEVPGVGKISRS